MNLLSFITTLLLIFSITASFMLKQHKDTSLLKQSIDGYYKAYFLTENNIQKHLYKIQKAEKKTPLPKASFPKKTVQNEEPKKSSLKRDDKSGVKKIYPCAQINVTPLLKKGKEEIYLYDLMNKLITSLYPKKFHQILDKLLSNYKNSSLQTISFNKESDRKLWYQMLQGTKFYDFEKKIGYPSILEFIYLGKDVPQKLCICKMPKELLSVLFKEKAEHIASLKDKDLKDFFKNRSDALFYDLSHKNHKKSVNRIICQDAISKISITTDFSLEN